MSVLENLNRLTLELRKSRDELAGAFQSTQATATAFAKEKAIKAGTDLSAVKADSEDALRSIQRSIKQVRDTLALKPDHAPSLRELSLLEGLLPQMASEDEIRGEVESFVATLDQKTMKQMGAIMAHLASVFGTSLDKAKASKVAAAIINTRNA